VVSVTDSYGRNLGFLEKKTICIDYPLSLFVLFAQKFHFKFPRNKLKLLKNEQENEDLHFASENYAVAFHN
jgi:hypothetical protein